jgi:hypothetical protein
MRLIDYTHASCSQVGHSTGTGIIDFAGGLALKVVDGFTEEVEETASGDELSASTQDLTAPSSYVQQAQTKDTSATLGVPCIYRNSSDFMLDTLEYLPIWESASKSLQHQADIDGPRLQAEMMALQHPIREDTCGDTPVTRGIWKTYGLGACLHLLHKVG